MASTTYVAVRADEENNAARWWEELRERFPRVAAALERDGGTVIAAGLWDELAALPGFADGPEYASTALIDCGSEGDGWCDVVSGRHQIFEVLE